MTNGYYQGNYKTQLEDETISYGEFIEIKFPYQLYVESYYIKSNFNSEKDI